jgi:hypothetical protein
MIQGNLLGFAMFVLCGVIALIGSFVLKLPNAPVMITIGATLILMDLIFRLKNLSKQGWLTKKELGGYLYFAPVWIFGIIVIVINIINVLVNTKK